MKYLLYSLCFLLFLLIIPISSAINIENIETINNSIIDENNFQINFNSIDIDNNYLVSSMNKDIIGWWKFDENESDSKVIDHSGKGNYGELYGNTSFTSTSKFGNAIEYGNKNESFNGIEIYRNSSFDTKDSFTISTWIQMEEKGGHETIFTYGSTASSPTYEVYNLAVSTTNKITLKMSNSTDFHTHKSRKQIKEKQWYHVVASYNSTHTKLYIDGELESVSPTPENFIINPTPPKQKVSVGGNANENRRFFEGYIDDLLLFNRSLIEGEIKNLYSITSKSVEYNYKNVLEDDYSLKFYEVGRSNTLSTSPLNFKVSFSPIIDIHSPLESNKYDNKTLLVNISVYSANPINSILFNTNSSNTTYTDPKYFTFSNGNHTFEVIATDDKGKKSRESISLYINSSQDFTPPEISYNEEMFENTISSFPKKLSISLNEKGNAWFSINNENYSMDENNDNTHVGEIPAYLENGRYTLTFYANDTSNNLARKNITLDINKSSGTTSAIGQYGITWYFDSPVKYGTFANGDIWVKGPVTIVNITPEFSNNSIYNNNNELEGHAFQHGWEVNPTNISAQGFDSRFSGFNKNLIPNIPLRIEGNKSVVKGISLDGDQRNRYMNCRPCLKTAAVLTVLDFEPENKGSELFRPQYFGENKSFISTNSINTNLLPQYPLTGDEPSFSKYDNLQKIQLDHKYDWTGRFLHPIKNLPDYGADIAVRNNEISLLLMMNYSLSKKWKPLVWYLQMGVDIYGIASNDGGWRANGGHGQGRKLPLTFTSLLLGNKTMQKMVSNEERTEFQENDQIQRNINNKSIFGAKKGGSIEKSYWKSITTDQGARTIMDPYKYIDGGVRPGASYQYCCTSQTYKGSVLSLHLLDDLKPIWNDSEIIDYVERWVNKGALTQPDVCAPADGVCKGGSNNGDYCNTAGETGDGSCDGLGGCNTYCEGGGYCDYSENWPENYGVTYGPNSTTGTCILDDDTSDGTGRFPLLHERRADGGAYRSGFVDTLWNEYRYDSNQYQSKYKSNNKQSQYEKNSLNKQNKNPSDNNGGSSSSENIYNDNNNDSPNNDSTQSCSPDYSYGIWDVCKNGTQTRTVIDLNACEFEKKKQERKCKNDNNSYLISNASSINITQIENRKYSTNYINSKNNISTIKLDEKINESFILVDETTGKEYLTRLVETNEKHNIYSISNVDSKGVKQDLIKEGLANEKSQQNQNYVDSLLKKPLFPYMIVIFITIIFLLFIILTPLYIKKVHSSKNLSQKDKLREYIKIHKKEEGIKEKLKDAGWDDETIEKTFKEI